MHIIETLLGNNVMETRRNTLVKTNQYKYFDERIYWSLWYALRQQKKGNTIIQKPNERDKNNK